MKKQIVFSLVGLALAGVYTTSYAQGVPGSAAAPTMIAAPADSTATAQLSAKEAKKVKLQEAITKMENNLQVRIKNLDELAAKIQTRIGKMQLEGKDMTAPIAALSSAQKTIADAKADLVILQKRIATMATSKTPAAAFATVKRSATLGVVTKIKAAHKGLVDTIVSMKGQGTPGVVPPATSTGI